MKINIKNKEKIEKAFELVQKDCRVRLVCFSDLTELVERAEKALIALRIPKKYWNGTVIEYHPHTSKRSYRYIMFSSYAKLQKFNSGWFLIYTNRIDSKYGKSNFGMILSEFQKAHVKSSFNL